MKGERDGRQDAERSGTGPRVAGTPAPSGLCPCLRLRRRAVLLFASLPCPPFSPAVSLPLQSATCLQEVLVLVRHHLCQLGGSLHRRLVAQLLTVLLQEPLWRGRAGREGGRGEGMRGVSQVPAGVSQAPAGLACSTASTTNHPACHRPPTHPPTPQHCMSSRTPARVGDTLCKWLPAHCHPPTHPPLLHRTRAGAPTNPPTVTYRERF